MEHEAECACCAGGYSNFVATIEKTVEAVGWAIVHVPGDASGPSFSYTIGLNGRGWPEIVVFGLPSQVSHIILNDLVLQHVKAATAPTHGSLITEVANLPCMLVAGSAELVDKYAVQAEQRAVRLKQAPVTCLQLVIPDREGRLPWQDSFDHDLMDAAQPCMAIGGQWPQLETNV